MALRIPDEGRDAKHVVGAEISRRAAKHSSLAATTNRNSLRRMLATAVVNLFSLVEDSR